MTIVEEIAVKSAKLPLDRQHEVLDFVELVSQRLRAETSSDVETRKQELLRRGRELVHRVRQRNAHLSEEQIVREIDEAVNLVRRQG